MPVQAVVGNCRDSEGGRQRATRLFVGGEEHVGQGLALCLSAALARTVALRESVTLDLPAALAGVITLRAFQQPWTGRLHYARASRLAFQEP